MRSPCAHCWNEMREGDEQVNCPRTDAAVHEYCVGRECSRDADLQPILLTGDTQTALTVLVIAFSCVYGLAATEPIRGANQLGLKWEELVDWLRRYGRVGPVPEPADGSETKLLAYARQIAEIARTV